MGAGGNAAVVSWPSVERAGANLNAKLPGVVVLTMRLSGIISTLPQAIFDLRSQQAAYLEVPLEFQQHRF
jgi:hypothetical protein